MRRVQAGDEAKSLKPPPTKPISKPTWLILAWLAIGWWPAGAACRTSDNSDKGRAVVAKFDTEMREYRRKMTILDRYQVRVLPRGTHYHTQNHYRGRGDLMSLSDALMIYQPCSVCRPPWVELPDEPKRAELPSESWNAWGLFWTIWLLPLSAWFSLGGHRMLPSRKA